MKGASPTVTLEEQETAIKYAEEEPADIDAMSLYLRDMAVYSVMTPEEEYAVASKAVKGDPAAIEEMVLRNQRLVISIAKKCLGRGLPMSDMVQEGNLGLMHAIEKFDCDRGLRFSTYATNWIWQSIQRALETKVNTIRIPSHIYTWSNQINRAREEYLIAHDGKEPSAEEISKMTGLDTEKINYTKELKMLEPISYDIPVNEEESETTLEDFIPDRDAKSLDEQVNAIINRETITQIIDTVLNDRDAELLKLRYGITDSNPMTLMQLAARYGITRERVRQIEFISTKRIRTWLKKHPSENIFCDAHGKPQYSFD